MDWGRRHWVPLSNQSDEGKQTGRPWSQNLFPPRAFNRKRGKKKKKGKCGERSSRLGKSPFFFRGETAKPRFGGKRKQPAPLLFFKGGKKRQGKGKGAITTQSHDLFVKKRGDSVSGPRGNVFFEKPAVPPRPPLVGRRKRGETKKKQGFFPPSQERVKKGIPTGVRVLAPGIQRSRTPEGENQGPAGKLRPEKARKEKKKERKKKRNKTCPTSHPGYHRREEVEEMVD